MSRPTVIVIVLGLLLLGGVAVADVIDATYQYAWGENIGWLAWGTSEGNVFVPDSATDGELTGYVWGENVGWVSLNCSNTSSCGTVDYKVERSQGELTGYAWGENVGWISFSCANTGTCGTVDYGVSIATSSGEFSGYAWGENVGWIVTNCSTTASCGAVDYKVLATASATPSPTPDGGEGIYLPTPTPEPEEGTPTPEATEEPPGEGEPEDDEEPAVVPPEEGPPGEAPPGPPQPGPGPGRGIGDGVTGLIDRVLGTPVESGASVTIAIGIIPILLALVEATQTQAIGAMSYSFFQAVGLRKKARVWGTVYDANTKHPIPYARVQILDDANRVLETRFADRDGRYGFLLSAPGTQETTIRRVHIIASKSGFAFPSQRIGEGSDFVVYEHPYRGETIEVTTDATLAYDIPMDPITATASTRRPPFLAVIGSGMEAFLNVGFFAGLILVPWNLVRHPSALNIGIAVVFVAANLIRILYVYRPYGRVREVTTGELLPFALVTLHDERGMRRAFAVSDERGRYFMSAKSDRSYTLKAQTPANYTPSRTVSHDIAADTRALKRGWVTKNITV